MRLPVWTGSHRLAMRLCIAALLGLGPLAAHGQPPGAEAASALHASRLALEPRLRASAFGEPLVLQSRDHAGGLEGDIHAEVPHAFPAVQRTFRSASGICEVLFLHLNVRACTASGTAGTERISLVVGPKRTDTPGAQYRMRYVVRTEVADAGYLRVVLSADQGPLGTKDYRMLFEAVPLGAGRSFVHFGYAYRYGTLARLAMGAYLATAGRSKIGFTVEGRDAHGDPVYVRGERAALERNAMRYYLAVQAHLSVATGSREERGLARQKAWFALTERHAAQLHEYSLAEYLQEKRKDLARRSPGRT